MNRSLIRSSLRAAPILALLLVFATGKASAETPAAKPAAKQAAPTPEGIQVPKPPFTEGIFPCTACHDGKAVKLNTKQRELKDMHTDIELTHGPESRWCLDCHDANDRDHLKLASGEKVEFTASYKKWCSRSSRVNCRARWRKWSRSRAWAASPRTSFWETRTAWWRGSPSTRT